MGIFDFLRRKEIKKDIENDTQNKLDENLPKMLIDKDTVNSILEKEIRDFFPVQNNGRWSRNCFKQPKEVEYGNLPCHLRDNAWMSKLMYNVLLDKGIFIPQQTIKSFIDNSQLFADLRHEHELRIVKWQINWIRNGGANWLMPEGYCEMAELFSEDVDKIIRGGVLKTLKAIGMDEDVIEEGLEKYSDIWRTSAMELGYSHVYEPVVYMYGTPEKADEDHKKNWIANREYEYYQEHKNSVDNYGTITPAMQMTPEEHSKLFVLLEQQNIERKKLVDEWRASFSTNFYSNINKKSPSQEGEGLSK